MISDALLDTNLIIRYLTGEPKAQAEATKSLLERANAGNLTLRLSSLVVAEVVFVLTGKTYQFPRGDVKEALLPLLQWPQLDVQDREVLLNALDLFTHSKIDFVDACLAAEARLQQVAIASFDKDYDSISGITRIDPINT